MTRMKMKKKEIEIYGLPIVEHSFLPDDLKIIREVFIRFRSENPQNGNIIMTHQEINALRGRVYSLEELRKVIQRLCTPVTLYAPDSNGCLSYVSKSIFEVIEVSRDNGKTIIKFQLAPYVLLKLSVANEEDSMMISENNI